MALKSNNKIKTRVSDVSTSNEEKTKTQPASENQAQASEAATISPVATDSASNIDLAKIISESKQAISNEPQKRKRRTKEEMSQARGVASQPALTQPMVEQDLTAVVEPVLKVVDKLGSKYLAQKNNLDAKLLQADDDTILEVSKSLNKPLNIISHRLGQNQNIDPLYGAMFSVCFCLGSMYLSKALIISDLKDANKT